VSVRTAVEHAGSGARLECASTEMVHIRAKTHVIGAIDFDQKVT
jgi:hypothetical protein